jgi:hypothetical protein
MERTDLLVVPATVPIPELLTGLCVVVGFPIDIFRTVDGVVGTDGGLDIGR